MFVFLQCPQRLWSTIKGIPVKLLELRDIQKCNRMPFLLSLDLKFTPGLAPIRARSVQTNQTQATPFANQFNTFHRIVLLFRACILLLQIYTDFVSLDRYLCRIIWLSTYLFAMNCCGTKLGIWGMLGNLFLNLPLRRHLSAMGGLFFKSEV